ncbi:Folylpolyglutamate synthase [Smittium mucronatum]|uniref:tetrahydrofolate synthase n=1 Tax=Smittium mucronatum TaxID=133383 RepID=A0A1R0H3F6_9FUNG|nr:Folylpolyglutamate synthase [Smittium mucronatum]
MISVNERIQLNGIPLEKKKFAQYFHEVWDKLCNTENCPNTSSKQKDIASENSDSTKTSMELGSQPELSQDMLLPRPSYFRFLTVMAFHTYLREGVNAAIIEVGIGGEYDSTNIVKSPSVTAITSIGLDHVDILGKDLRSIAWNKSGIMKSGVAAIVYPELDSDVRDVFVERASEREAELKFCHKLDTGTDSNNTKSGSSQIKLGIEGSHQNQNAAIAIETVFEWLKKTGYGKILGLDVPVLADSSCFDRDNLPHWVLQALSDTFWPGRSQHFTDKSNKNIQWYLDGAHTVDSIQASAFIFIFVSLYWLFYIKKKYS